MDARILLPGLYCFLGSKPLSREKGISEDDRGEDAINEEMNYIGLKGVGSLLFTCTQSILYKPHADALKPAHLEIAVKLQVNAAINILWNSLVCTSNLS